MAFSILRRIIALMPMPWQHEIKRLYCKWKIRNGCFLTDEPEYAILDSFITSGDWVIDIGANIGHYTNKLSQLVGDNGRVIAIEPVPETFSLLAANMLILKRNNISLFNIAVSDANEIVGMTVPNYDNGTKNYYQAHLTKENAQLKVLAISVDCINIPTSVSLIKIDSEGHELSVLKGMKLLLERDHPILIIETSSHAVTDFLMQMGYQSSRLEQSPNQIYKPCYF